MDKSKRCVYNEIVPEPLTEENHEEWFEWVRNYLTAQNLWEVVDGTTAAPPEDEDHREDFVRWKIKNAAALHVIQISCTPQSFLHIVSISEAREAWDILNDIYNLPELESSPQVTGEQVEFNATNLYKAIYDGDWYAIQTFLNEHPSAATAKLTLAGETILHLAAQFGHVSIIGNLLELVPSELLEIVDDDGNTPLAIAAIYSSVTRVAEYMVNKNSNLLGILSPGLELPVTLAYENGHKEMGRYIYSVTPLECLRQERGQPAQKLLYWCFSTGDLDVALDLLQRFGELLYTTDPEWGPIMDIAAMPSTFPSGSQFAFWKQWIYNYINIQSATTDFVHVDIEDERKSRRIQGLGPLRYRISKAYDLLGIKEIYELKLLHTQVGQILNLLCENVASIVRNKQARRNVSNALFRAAREGNVEFVVKVSKAYPELILLHSGISNWNTFFYAVEYRQAEVFNLIRGLRFKDSLASNKDASENTLLHVAGKLAPSFQLNRISGPAFQMQRELQWFKEVESVVPPGFKRLQNRDGMRPEDIFKESHKELRKEGEKWMKETASSCSVVGALVVTIMFAATFTVPGGNDQEKDQGTNQNYGYPIFLGEKLFLLFIISDALSLFSSSTSVLMFLGILTSRYAEEDFLISLPRKLIIGLSALFLSIATMMIAFSSCILMMLEHTYSWSLLPVVILASIPVTLFVLLQYPLLAQMVFSTYGQGIFNRNGKPWL